MMVRTISDHIAEGLSSPKSGLLAQTQCEFTGWRISSLFAPKNGAHQGIGENLQQQRV